MILSKRFEHPTKKHPTNLSMINVHTLTSRLLASDARFLEEQPRIRKLIYEAERALVSRNVIDGWLGTVLRNVG